MNCIAAILLLTGRNSPMSDRMVISGGTEYNSIYDIIPVNSARRFLVPERKSGIFMTQNQGNQPGTYVAAYCSFELDALQIYHRIVDGTISLYSKAHIGFSNDAQLEKHCSDLTSKIHQMQPKRIPVHVSGLRYPRECTEIVLVSLAFQGMILLQGEYGLTSALATSDGLTIILDKPLEVKNFVLNGEFFILKTTESKEYALAWYQGHLHVFNKLIGTDFWYLTSNIGHEIRNGKFISELILENHPDIVSFQDQLLALSPSSRTISSTQESRLPKIFRGKGKHALQLKELEVKTPRLAATPATGFLCGNIGPAEFSNTLEYDNPWYNALMYS
ncbi:BgTH12-04882 [Blumeria graminis f. sp. triticale]|uniref:BgTH12-04882 n=1 Tax=Blumeria graminis f. sp. triticale TaxID=1689686 RepID=A0A9W4CVH7_BLUGR|nr:BgTH12-04882 [Blumeria graminis f. sp. triticale]